MNKIGIYQIVNKINQKKYIGSSIRLLGRKKRHFSELNCNIHHSQALQRAYNKYGKDNFNFFILEYCEDEKLLEREQYYLDNLKPEYNICKIAGNCLGIKQSKESIDKRNISLQKYWEVEGLKRPYSKQNKTKKKELNFQIKEQQNVRNLKIVKDLKSGIRQDVIAKKYNLSPSVITQLKKKNNIVTEISKGNNNGFSKLTEEQVKEIKYLLKDKVKQQIIADKYNVKLRTIKAIQSGQNWNHITIE
jgi:group I intron endonuclease